MTENPHRSENGFDSPLVLGLAAYVIFPILGIVTAAMGMILILNDNVTAGIIFVVLLAQLWVAGGLWTHLRRKKVLADKP